MRKWILVAAFIAFPAWAQEQCEAYRVADPKLQVQFIPHIAAPPGAYLGISYNSESLVQVQADDLSGRKAKILKKSAEETCNCFKMITDGCRTVFVPAGQKNTFTIIDAYKHGIVFILPAKK